MIFVFVSYNYSPDFSSPGSWLKRTEIYNGLIECLAKEHTVISIKQINYEGECTHKGVQHHFVKFGKKTSYFPWALNRYVKNLNPDVVFIQGLHQPLQLIQLGLILNKKTKVIAQHHAEKPFTGIKKYLQKMAGRYVDAYLFASKYMGLDWVEKGNLPSAEKIYEVMEVSSPFYPIKKELALAKTGISANPVFLWVGRLNANKDPLNVVKAFLKFAAVNPEARLYMIYHTEELLVEIKELLNNKPAADAIKLIGEVPNDELLYWYNSADFIVSGSHYEGSGTALCEAMSCGCIPIVTDIFSFRMITDNGNCGILYEPGNEEKLLSALKQSAQMDLQEQSERALAYFKSDLSFEAIARRIQEIALSL